MKAALLACLLLAACDSQPTCKRWGEPYVYWVFIPIGTDFALMPQQGRNCLEYNPPEEKKPK